MRTRLRRARTAICCLPLTLSMVLPQALHAAQAPLRPAETEQDRTQQASIGLQQQKDYAAPDGFSAHGVANLAFLATPDAGAGVNLVAAQAELFYAHHRFGLYAAPRLTLTPVGTRADRGDLFFQQLYAVWQHRLGEAKLGKVMGLFGRAKDYGIYGPLVANYNMKTQPDLGLSLEGSPGLGGPWQLDYGVQYFVADGHSVAPFTNPSLFARANVRRRNRFVGNLGPRYQLSEDTAVQANFSAETFELNVGPGGRTSRFAVHLDFTHGPLAAFVEAGHQQGTDVVIEIGAYTPANTFAWGGVRYGFGMFNARYHANVLRYDGPHGALEVLHQPGVEAEVTDNFALAAEGVLWTTSDLGAGMPNGYKERSLYLVATGKF